MASWSENCADPFEAALRAVEDRRFDTIGFDVFDTLLVRPVLEPNDLFHLVDLAAAAAGISVDFAGLRPAAEAHARRTLRRRSPDREETTLAEIHAALADLAGLSTEASDALRELEIAVERRILRAREPMRTIYEAARRRGKRVVVVSDSSASPSFIAEMLERVGYDPPDHLYVSSDVGRTKATGRLFAHLLADLRLDPGRILHIGDNYGSDCRRPRALGLAAVHVPRPTHLYFSRDVARSLWGGGDVTLDPAHRLLLGMSILRHFDRGRDDVAVESDAEAHGHLLLGPLLVAAAAGAAEVSSRLPAIEAIVAAEPEGPRDTPFRRMMRGARRAASEAESLFGPAVADLRLDVDRLVVPLARARAGAVPAARSGWFSDPLLRDLLDTVADPSTPTLSFARRAELRLLEPLLMPNRFQRLVVDPARFFRDVRRPALRLYARLRPLVIA